MLQYYRYYNISIFQVLQVLLGEASPEPDRTRQQQECVHSFNPAREEFWKMPISGNIVDQRRSEAASFPLTWQIFDTKTGTLSCDEIFSY